MRVMSLIRKAKRLSSFRERTIFHSVDRLPEDKPDYSKDKTCTLLYRSSAHDAQKRRLATRLSPRFFQPQDVAVIPPLLRNTFHQIESRLDNGSKLVA